MDPLVRSALFAQQVLGRATGLVIVIGGGALFVGVAAGAVSVSWALIAGAAILVSLVYRAIRLWRGQATGHRVRLEAELMGHGILLAYVGIWFLSSAASGVAIDPYVIGPSAAAAPTLDSMGTLGGLNGPWLALIYLVFMAIAAFGRPWATAMAVVMAIALESGLRFFGLAEREPLTYVLHGGLLIAFAFLNAFFVRAEIERVRRLSRSHISGEMTRLREAARSYRLLGGASVTGELTNADNQERLLRSGVDEIRNSERLALELLCDALQLETAALLWLDATGEEFRLEQVASHMRELSAGPFPARDGILSAVLAQAKPVELAGPRCRRLLPYYADPVGGAAVAAVPVSEGAHTRGIIVTDREEARPFSESELGLLAAAAHFVMRSVQNERVFAQLESARVEQGKLYRAVGKLSQANTEAEVIQQGVLSARSFADFDFVAVTLLDEGGTVHDICAVSGEGSDELVGTRFKENAGLVSMAVANRHALPYRGVFERSQQTLFCDELQPPALLSLLVIPLVVRERALGTLVLGSYRPRAFPDGVRPTLEVLASHIAVSLAGARMLRTLEGLATTDGMTQLLNKRALVDIGSQKIRSALRFDKPLSLVVCDIDLFKSVNDTYGHDIGDDVIRGVADVLRRSKRETDVVGRFGGEEFVVVCEETDSEGALLLAERVRRELEATVFHTGKGTLSVTCSLGIATCPAAGKTWADLFKATDEALYASKRGGRNRATVWSRERHSHAASSPDSSPASASVSRADVADLAI